MKTLTGILLLVLTLPVAPASADPVAASPLVGRWAVDVSRLPMPREARPLRVTIAFSDAGEGKWTTLVDIVDAGGTETRAIGTASLDGTAASVAGSAEADTAALKMPASNVLVMALGKGGVPASTRIYTMAADGRTMVETAVYFGRDGMPILRTNHFTRLP